MDEIQTQIARWQKREISGTQLLRGFVGYDKWVVPVSERAMKEALSSNTAPAISYNRSEQGENSLHIFSDGGRYQQFQKAAGGTGELYFLTVQGTWVFGLPLKDFAFFNINPLSEYSVHYRREQFEMLNDAAFAVRIERKLKALRYGEISGDDLEPCLAEIKNYQNFYLVLEFAGEKAEPVIAPDNKERKLLAAFTAQDNANIFYDELEQVFPGRDFRLAPSNGSLLAQTLLKSNYEGIVFNCRGYVEPIAFTPPLAELILNAK
jgi:hypothetical protein